MISLKGLYDVKSIQMTKRIKNKSAIYLLDRKCDDSGLNYIV